MNNVANAVKSDDGCPYINIHNCPKDKPTSFAGLGVRFLFTILAWSVLGLNITPGNSFFVSSMLFSGPLCLEYKKFVPNTNLRKKLCFFGFIVAGIIVLVSIIGLIGIISIVEQESEFYIQVSKTFIVLRGVIFPLNFIWYIIGCCVVMTGIDWVVYEGNLENKYIEHRYHENKEG